MKFFRFVWGFCSAPCRPWSYRLWTAPARVLKELHVPSQWRSFWTEPFNTPCSSTASQRSPRWCLWATHADIKPHFVLILNVKKINACLKFEVTVSNNNSHAFVLECFRRRCSFLYQLWTHMFTEGPCVHPEPWHFQQPKVKSSRSQWVHGNSIASRRKYHNVVERFS